MSLCDSRRIGEVKTLNISSSLNELQEGDDLVSAFAGSCDLHKLLQSQYKETKNMAKGSVTHYVVNAEARRVV